MAAKTKKRKRSKAENDFIKGRTDRVTVDVDGKLALGYSPAQATASGAGAHGGSRRAQHKRDRRAARRSLRGGDWD